MGPMPPYSRFLDVGAKRSLTLREPCYVQETFHSEGWRKVVGCEFTQAWSFVAWASDFTSLSFSFLIYKK